MRQKFLPLCVLLWILFMALGLFGCQKEESPALDVNIMSVPSVGSILSDASSQSTQTTEPSPSLEPSKYNEYVVRLEVEPETRTIQAIEKVSFYNQTGAALEQIVLHVYANAFTADYSPKPYFDNYEAKIFKSGKDFAEIKIVNALFGSEEAEFSLNGTELLLTPSTPVAADETCELTIQFEAYIPKINHRIGASQHALWLGNFIPTLAVYENGGWQTNPYYRAGDPFYTESAKYTVTVVTPAGYTVAGTGLDTSSETDGVKTTVLTSRLVRDFALAISKDYQKSSITTDDGVEISLYHYSDLQNVDEILETARKSLAYFSEKIAGYPYRKLDIVECGLFFEGGMEYPQAIFMDSDYMKKSDALRTLVHEIGHQWFYNIVGNNQVTEAWLDEGMVMTLQEGFFFSQEDVYQRMVSDHEALSKKLDSIRPNTLTADISRFTSWSDYYNTQYTRGKLMIYSLSLQMGPTKFEQLLRTYYNQFAYKVAAGKEFIQMAEDIYGSDLTEFFQAWMTAQELPPLLP